MTTERVSETNLTTTETLTSANVVSGAGIAFALIAAGLYGLMFYMLHNLPSERNELEKAVEVRAAIDGQLVRFQQADRVARALYDQLKAQMDPDRFAAAWSRGKSRDLCECVLALRAVL